jgi:2-iminobutanoate/2-iminopropanoate deaminase
VNINNLIAAACVVGGALMTSGCATPDTGGKVVLSTDKIYPAIGPYSHMIGHGKLIYFSGVIPLNQAGTAIEGTTFEEQTRKVLGYIGAELASQGLGFEDVLTSTVYMKDLN